MRKILLVLLFVLFTVFSLDAYAIDMPLGNKGLGTGSIAPGTFNMIYEMEQYFGIQKDNNANNVIGIGRKKIQVNSFAAALAAEWHTNAELLGGTYSFALVVPAVNVWINNASPSGTLDFSGTGDFWLEPLDISWKVTPQFDARFILGFNLPVGSQGITFDHFSTGVGGSFTYYFDAERTIHLSAYPSFEIHSTNLSNDRTEGIDFLVKWGVGKSFGFNTIGLIGYSYQQLTEDSGTPRFANNRDKQSAHAIGIQYNRYIPSINSVFALLVNQELYAENRSMGTRVHFAYIKIY